MLSTQHNKSSNPLQNQLPPLLLVHHSHRMLCPCLVPSCQMVSSLLEYVRYAKLIDDIVQDEGLKRVMMAWYYAGYYSGLYEGQQQARQSKS